MSQTLKRLLPLCGMLAPWAATMLSSACSSGDQRVASSELTEPATNSQAISAADASMPVLLADAAAPEAPPPSGQGQCSALQVTATRILPTVWLMVDGSGSMVEALSATEQSSRWGALRSALLDPNAGIVKNSESQVRWGFLAYDGPLDGADSMTPAGSTVECPRLVEVAPALNNFAALATAFTPEPLGGSTPTAKALESLTERFASPGDASAVIIFSDGQPDDFCANTPAEDVRKRVVEQVNDLHVAGHSVYVFSLAADDPELAQHVSDVAKASGLGSRVFAPKSVSEIRDNVSSIVGYPTACEVLLNGRFRGGDLCRASVALNGAMLECSSENGWRLKDDRIVELTGEACASFKSDAAAEVTIDFPCDLIDLD